MAATSTHTLSERELIAPDGGSVRLLRAGDGTGPPVVLLHGMFDTRRVFVGVGGGLIGALLERGFDPWIPERRKAGADGAARIGLEEVLRYDLPMIQREVLGATGQSAAWLGHSYGGVLLARGVTTTLDTSQIWAAVLVASAVDPPALLRPAPRAFIKLASRGGTMPAERLRIGPANEALATMADALRWARDFRAGRGRSWSLGTRDLPLLAIVGARDLVTPPRDCRRLVKRLGLSGDELLVVGRDSGVRRSVGHESILVHPSVSGDTGPLIGDWLLEQAPARVASRH